MRGADRRFGEMKVQRVYLDTSVIGGCFDTEFAPWSDGLMQDFRERYFKPVVSELVEAEVDEAPERVRNKLEEILALEAEVVSVTDSALELADAYQRRGILSPKFYDDGLHIALATISNVDILTSWNFKHIVHFDKIRLFAAINLEMGYRPVQIYSPREVTRYGER